MFHKNETPQGAAIEYIRIKDTNLGEAGRPGGNRTPNLRFWRPPLCQLSYWPGTRVRPTIMPAQEGKINRLFDDLGNHAGANGTAAFANREAQTFFHGDRSDQGDGHLDVVTRHDHLDAFRQFAVAGHVGGTEVELRTVALEERGVTTAFFLAQHVHFAFELGVRLDGARLGQNLTTLHVFTLGTTQQNANVLTGATFVQQLAEHFHAGAGGLGGRTDADDFHFFLNLDDAALDTTGHHGAAAGDGEHVFDRHQERLVDGTLRLRNVGVQGLDQLAHGRGTDLGLVTFQGLQGGTDDDRSVVAREVVGVQ